MIKHKPVVGVATSTTPMPNTEFFACTTGTRAIKSLVEFSDCIPLQIPSIVDTNDCEELINRVDGVMLTGGRANIEPHHFGGKPFPDDETIDPDRDKVVLSIIPACIKAGKPILGICRGIQEINVALGGTLHYRIHLLADKNDHRMAQGDHILTDDIFALRHKIELPLGGYLNKLIGQDSYVVNSLHGQGIDKVGSGLTVEAMSEDGVIEAIRVTAHPNFAIGVQWHAEYIPNKIQHELSWKLFREFGKAARDYS